MIYSFIITGFLGVGKSSLLTQTIQNHFRDKRVAIVVNEFGEVGVDQNILKNVHSDVIEISEGCICCQMAQEFESGVIEIINKYNPEIIFVETSGAAEPFPIFLSLQNLGISIEGVICVCDVKNYKSYIHNSSAKYQIGGSNIIVLNKCDLVDKEELEIAKKEICAIKDEYNLKNTLTSKPVFNSYFLHQCEQGILAKEVFEGAYEISEIIGLAKDYREHNSSSHDFIDKKVMTIASNVSFDDIENLLKSLPKNIYRVKGMIKTEDLPTPLIVNHSFGNSSFEELKEPFVKSLLVFIGEDITKNLESLVDRFDFLTTLKPKHEHNHNHHEDHHHD